MHLCWSLPNSACQTGNLSIVQHLLGAGADALIANSRQQTVLYAAIHHGHASIVRHLLTAHPELVQQSTTAEKWSALHAACINGSTDIARQLIEYPYPESALRTIRCTVQLGDGDDNGDTTVEYRLPFDPNARDITGQTPLYVACLLGNTAMVQLLFDWRVPFRRRSARDKSADRNGSDDAATSAAVGAGSSTPSSTASTTPATTPSATSSSRRRVSMGIQSIMDRLYLVRDGAPESTEGTDGCGRFDEQMSALQQPASNTQLLRCPLELNQLCGAPRETPLLAAVRGGYTEVVALLLEHGADPNAIAKPQSDDQDNSMQEDLYGCSNSPLAEATRQTAVDILDLLLK